MTTPSPALTDEERAAVGEALRLNGFYSSKVRARILDIFDATLSLRHACPGFAGAGCIDEDCDRWEERA